MNIERFIKPEILDVPNIELTGAARHVREQTIDPRAAEAFRILDEFTTSRRRR